MDSIIKPKRPLFEGWVRQPDPPQWVSLGFECEAWFLPSAGFTVFSAVAVAKDNDGIERGPEYHLSMSRVAREGPPRRVSLQDAKQILKHFGVDGAEEDNHVPGGVVRNFWRPVAENMIGLECACKDDEPTIREDKGDYVWRGATE